MKIPYNKRFLCFKFTYDIRVCLSLEVIPLFSYFIKKKKNKNAQHVSYRTLFFLVALKYRKKHKLIHII